MHKTLSLAVLEHEEILLGTDNLNRYLDLGRSTIIPWPGQGLNFCFLEPTNNITVYFDRPHSH
jgi:hypothetical protein